MVPLRATDRAGTTRVNGRCSKLRTRTRAAVMNGDYLFHGAASGHRATIASGREFSRSRSRL